MQRALAFFAFVMLVATGCAIAAIAAPLAFGNAPFQIGAMFGQVVGSGDVTRETRTVSAFRRISVNGSTDVRVRIGSDQSVVVEGQPNIIGIIETKVSDGTLSISSTQSYTTNRDVVVHVTVPALDGVTVRGSADAYVDGVRGDNFDVSVYGSGDVTANGSVDRLTYTCNGSGSGKLKGLAARSAVVKVRGSGDARLNVSDTLDVEVSGSGDVVYSGRARVIRQVIRGSGSVSQS